MLEKYDPELFMNWWNDAMAYARHEAENGSDFAVECLQAYDHSPDRRPSRHHQVFHHYGFAYVGRRGQDGTFAVRDKFYTLSTDVLPRLPGLRHGVPRYAGARFVPGVIPHAAIH